MLKFEYSNLLVVHLCFDKVVAILYALNHYKAIIMGNPLLDTKGFYNDNFPSLSTFSCVMSTYPISIAYLQHPKALGLEVLTISLCQLKFWFKMDRVLPKNGLKLGF